MIVANIPWLSAVNITPGEILPGFYISLLTVIWWTNPTVVPGGSLSHVPHFLNPDIELLDISDNQIVKLESSLNYYTQLASINFSRNSLRSLGRDQFRSQTGLRDLELSDNLLSKIRVGAFNGLESVVSLNMRNNRIERLNTEVFTGNNTSLPPYLPP